MLALSVTFAFSVVGGPRRTNVNGIRWFDRLEDAQAEAKRTAKPILFFSMFGRLNEEMPCANARTLRATLFKDPEFKKLVTDEAIPAWESVRPVPKVEIDFGEGKKIVRTVRGNAVMYLCNPDGKVVDAFPGVYTARDFIPMVRESIKLLSHADPTTVLAYHRDRGAVPIPISATLGKTLLEGPTLDLIGARPIGGATTLGRPSDSTPRSLFLIAARRISDLSLTPMSPENAARRITGSSEKRNNRADLAQEILQRDSTTNMTFVRPVIHLWMASEKALPTPSQARDAVLETILKIPYKDPYFGLKDVLLPGTPG